MVIWNGFIWINDIATYISLGSRILYSNFAYNFTYILTTYTRLANQFVYVSNYMGDTLKSKWEISIHLFLYGRCKNFNCLCPRGFCHAIGQIAHGSYNIFTKIRN